MESMDTNEHKGLEESSVSRINDHLIKHDCGFITAWRSARDCNQGIPFTRKEKNERNKRLFALLKSKGYGITKVKGSYIEDYGSDNPKEVGEESFFVIDLKDSGNLLQDLLKLGKAFEQDAILFSKQGGEDVQLIGASDCENSFPGEGNSLHQGSLSGKAGEFFSRIGSRPFSFTEIAEPGIYGKAARKQLAEIYAEELKLKSFF